MGFGLCLGIHTLTDGGVGLSLRFGLKIGKVNALVLLIVAFGSLGFHPVRLTKIITLLFEYLRSIWKSILINILLQSFLR